MKIFSAIASLFRRGPKLTLALPPFPMETATCERGHTYPSSAWCFECRPQGPQLDASPAAEGVAQAPKREATTLDTSEEVAAAALARSTSSAWTEPSKHTANHRIAYISPTVESVALEAQKQLEEKDAEIRRLTHRIAGMEYTATMARDRAAATDKQLGHYSKQATEAAAALNRAGAPVFAASTKSIYDFGHALSLAERIDHLIANYALRLSGAKTSQKARKRKPRRKAAR